MTRAYKRLRVDEHVYGLGEKNGLLDKRGRQQGGYSYTMWNSDTFGYGADTDPIYVSVPFAIVMRAGRAHGLFLDNTSRTNFDIGHTSAGTLAFGAEQGELNYYFINGPTPADVVSRYTALTGRMPMPPRWALGYHQCRYSYYPESTVRFVAQNFRARRIPADAIWLDIHYQDGYKPFTWDAERFPDPARLVADLGQQGFHLVTIVDAHPKKEAGYEPYDTGIAGDHFVRNVDGSVYEAAVWPARAERNPGPSVFPDFTRAASGMRPCGPARTSANGRTCADRFRCCSAWASRACLSSGSTSAASPKRRPRSSTRAGCSSACSTRSCARTRPSARPIRIRGRTERSTKR